MVVCFRMFSDNLDETLVLHDFDECSHFVTVQRSRHVREANRQRESKEEADVDEIAVLPVETENPAPDLS